MKGSSGENAQTQKPEDSDPVKETGPGGKHPNAERIDEYRGEIHVERP
jgi:hypothetical protein